MLKIIRNKIQCNTCGDVIESTHVHDYVCCSCKAVAVDGGQEYLSRTGSPDLYLELSVFEPPLSSFKPES